MYYWNCYIRRKVHINMYFFLRVILQRMLENDIIIAFKERCDEQKMGML